MVTFPNVLQVDEDPYKTPMMIYLRHYTMGGTWVDYNYKQQFQVVSLLENQTSQITEQTG
jgi:succinate dehydrogenase/fumarate reductase flavoprotein subunit